MKKYVEVQLLEVCNIADKLRRPEEGVISIDADVAKDLAEQNLAEIVKTADSSDGDGGKKAAAKK